jgi:cytochrome oxidase Cu insertion factor (SCO1/SenC/PrrC family)
VAEEFYFADVDNNGTLDAQDALDTLSAWRRKTGIRGNRDILAMNVTADGRIDTVDVLASVEGYISGAWIEVYDR